MAKKIYSGARDNPTVNAFHNFTMSKYPQSIEDSLMGY